MRLLIALLASVVLFGAERKLPPKLEPIARLAASAPPEFAADGLLRLVESGRIQDKETVLDLAQQAFDLAAGAHFRVSRRGTAGITPDSRQGSLAKAYALKLDAVSLQSRAIMAILRVNTMRSRQMFAAMVRPELPALTCDDLLVYDPSAYYRALAAVVQSGFTQKERAKEDHVAFLLPYATQIQNPAQLAPLASAILSAGLTAHQREAVIAQFNGVLEATSADPRSFSASLNELEGVVTPEMSASFRKYVDRNTPSSPCDEAPKVSAQIGNGSTGSAADSTKSGAYWQSDAAKRLQAGARKLRFGDDLKQMLSDSDRATPAWQQKLADYEKELADWDASSEQSEADFYQQKCIVYEALVELIPPGAERDKALEAFVAFIAGSNLQAQSPAEWFMPVQAMLERVRNTNNGEPGKVLAAFESCGNPVLALYAALERTFYSGLPSWLPGAGQ